MHIILGVFSTMILTPSLCLELSETWVAPQHYCHMFSPSATVYCHASKSLLPRCLSCCHCLLPRFQVLAALLFAFVITAPLRFQPYTEYYTAKLLRCYAEFFLGFDCLPFLHPASHTATLSSFILVACHSSIMFSTPYSHAEFFQYIILLSNVHRLYHTTLMIICWLNISLEHDPRSSSSSAIRIRSFRCVFDPSAALILNAPMRLWHQIVIWSGGEPSHCPAGSADIPNVVK